MIRKPAVSGQFYSGSKDELEREVTSLIDFKVKKAPAIGVVSPHAGYVYSGPVAGKVLSEIKPTGTYIILGPNHTGLGEELRLDESEIWKMPLGDVKLNKALGDAILRNCRYISRDSLSHLHEHSIEVQIPFLQMLQKEFTITPISVACSDLTILREAGIAIAKSIRDLNIESDVTIIASSDMTHYESAEEAKRKDTIAIDAILKLDEAKLIRSVRDFDITMCGYAPTVIMLVAAKELGAKSARLVKYQTSGDVSGDYSSVVGYAGLIIK